MMVEIHGQITAISRIFHEAKIEEIADKLANFQYSC